jgi:hypothetical protein
MYTFPVNFETILAFLNGVAAARSPRGLERLEDWARIKWDVCGKATSFSGLVKIRVDEILPNATEEAKTAFLFAVLSEYIAEEAVNDTVGRDKPNS